MAGEESGLQKMSPPFEDRERASTCILFPVRQIRVIIVHLRMQLDRTQFYFLDRDRDAMDGQTERHDECACVFDREGMFLLPHLDQN